MIKLLITDLDDTLYSWLSFFIPAFYEMVDELSKILQKPEAELLQEYKQVHQEKGSVEYPYATLLLPSVRQKFPDYTKEQLMDVLNTAFHRFNSTRKKKLCLYPQVKETLEQLSKLGIIIVGYTESAEENGFYRLKKLSIDNFFRKVYVSNSQYERPDSFPSSPKTQIVHGKKPNPELLSQICKSEGALICEAIYVGDSLTKDIYMAKMAGITSVLCKYPKSDDADTLYQKLVAITNWTDKDFEYENRLKEQFKSQNITPDFTINSFWSLLSIISDL